MSLFDAVGLVILGGIVGGMLFLLAMMLGAAVESLILKVKGHATHK